MRARTISLLVAAAFAVCCGDDGGPADGEDAGGGGEDAGGGDEDAGGGDEDAGGGGEDAGTGDEDAAVSADTWASFAQAWFAGYCTECHGTATRDYTTIDHVRRDAARIRCGVADVDSPECGAGLPAPRQFPTGTGAHPTDPERQRLVAWIAAGLPE